MSWLERPTKDERIAQLENSIAALEKRHNDLLAAFDAWFDVVAKELGYVPQPGCNLTSTIWTNLYRASPRRHQVITAQGSTPTRVSATICAKRKKGKAK